MVFISKDVLPTFKRGEDVGSEQLMHMMDVFLKGCNELCARVDSIRNVSVHPESSIQSYPVIDRVNKNSDDILQLKQALEKDLADMIEEFQRLVELTGSYNDRIVALDFNKAKRKDLELLQEELVKCQKYADNLITAWHNGELNGATFLPSVDNNGNISWTNNKGLSNPATKNIIGPKGDKGDNAIYMQGVSAKQLALGLPPTVTNTGTATHPFLEFGIPIDIEAIDPKNWGLGYYTKAKTDLNAIKETGWYWVDADKSPVGYAAVLEHVQGLTSAFAKQMLYCVQGSYNTYTRVLANNSWTPWTVGDGQNTTISGAICNTAGASTEGYYPSVKLLGKTIETGTGDKSPDNPYVLSPSVPTKVVAVGKNLALNTKQTSITINGITYTKQSDGTVIANGTATSNSIYTLFSNVESKILKPNTQYTVSGCVGGSLSSYHIMASSNVAGVGTVFATDSPTPLNFSDVSAATFNIRVVSGTTCNNVLFKPQLEIGSTATPYEPYHAQEYQLPTLSLNTWDSYDCVSGELVIGSKEVVLNGSVGSWGYNSGNDSTNTVVFNYNSLSDKFAGPYNFSTDKFETISIWGTDSEGVVGYGSSVTLAFRVKKSRMAGWQDTWTSAQKVTAFKTWAQENNFNLTYQVANLTITQIASQDIIQNINVYNDVTDTQVIYNTHQASAIGMKRLQDTKLNKSDVVNNLTSTSTTAALSAAQGKWLNDNKVDKNSIVNNLSTDDPYVPLSASRGKWLNDNKVDKNSIVNNLSTDDPYVPLSAARGKWLNDNKVDKNSIVNNLSTDDPYAPLSANMGKWLHDNKAPSGFGLGTTGTDISGQNLFIVRETGMYFGNKCVNSPTEYITLNWTKVSQSEGTGVIIGRGINSKSWLITCDSAGTWTVKELADMHEVTPRNAWLGSQSAYNCKNGYLIHTRIPAKRDSMITIRLTGNAYEYGTPITTTYQFYNHVGAGDIVQLSGIGSKGSPELKVFHFNDEVCCAFYQSNTSQTYTVEVMTHQNSTIFETPYFEHSYVPSGATLIKTITPRIMGTMTFANGILNITL